MPIRYIIHTSIIEHSQVHKKSGTIVPLIHFQLTIKIIHYL
jgi:hypothetical protein